MKISIIIPVHNIENDITTCLDSIEMQHFDKAEYEILVILDVCTDNTENIVRGWQAQKGDVNLNIFYSNCHSPGGARNVGLNFATGQYILFVDGDDKLIHSEALSILYNAIQGHNAVRVMDHEMKGMHTKFSNRLTVWLHFFSRALIGDERFSDMLLNEDYEFVKRIRDKPEYNESIVTIPLYYYNYDNERMVQRIKDVRQATYERKKQGLPPLYVTDCFVFHKK